MSKLKQSSRVKNKKLYTILNKLSEEEQFKLLQILMKRRENEIIPDGYVKMPVNEALKIFGLG